MSLRVAAAGGAAPHGDTGEALASAERLLAAAAARGARVLVLPQRFLTGTGEPAQATALLSDAEPVRELATAARRHGVAVACGYVERCSGRLHDAALFIDGRGLAVANYRRTHLGEGEGPAGLAPGAWLNQVGFGGARLGLLVGADLDAPEAARALALAGATVLLLPTDFRGRPAVAAEAVPRVRAFENGCAVACATWTAGPGATPSRIVAADGEVLAEAAADGLAVADVPTTRPADAERRLAARRPQLYRRLAAPHEAEGGPRT